MPTTPILSPKDTLTAFRKDPIAFLRAISDESINDHVEFRLARRRFVLLRDPDLIEDLLVNQADSFEKGPGLLRSHPILGQGLLTAPTDGHIEYKRPLQPAFRRQRADEHVASIAAIVDSWSRNLQPGITNLHAKMMGLTLTVVSETLFDSSVTPDAATVSSAIECALRNLYGGFLPTGKASPGCPHSLASAQTMLEDAVGTLLKHRRGAAPVDRDFVSLLLNAHPHPLSAERIRDEAITIFLAGHESVANCLSWTWYLLAKHPDVEKQLHAEIDAIVPRGYLPASDDLAKLVFTKQVLLESMRMYPPAWMVSREAMRDVSLGTLDILAGDVVVAAQSVTHRDARYYPNPDTFDPDRWQDATASARPRYSYFPFGGGPRICIGEQFAWRELLSVVAVTASRWKFAITPETSGEWEPLITLRPKNGMSLEAQLRS